MDTVPEVLDAVARRGDLDVIAVTEHDTLRPGAEARELAAARGLPFGVICGAEITTLDGHLVALFIDEPVASFQRMEPTLEAIHRAGGIAVAPHPLSWLTRSVSQRVFARVAAVASDGVYFDAIEEYNASPAGRITSARAQALNRERLHLAALGASDAHFAASIGTGYTAFEGSTIDDLRRAIAARETAAGAARGPRMAELGYRRIVMQQWRGMMATPRAMGWTPTIRSFISSRRRARATDTRDPRP